jgi:hypothetical protein
MHQKSVLIVTYGFPPHIKSLGGAIRMLKLAEYLQNSGCKVQVLCARTPHFDTFGYDELLKSLCVTYVDDPVAMAGARYFTPGQPGVARSPSWRDVLKARLKRIVIEGLTPDTGMLAVRRMRRAALDIARNDPQLTVITSGPPHSTHLVGSWLKQRVPSVHWIVDYRDSWNGSSLFRKQNAVLQKFNERFERKVLRQCDTFTYISQPMLGKAVRHGTPSLQHKAHLIANGFDASILQQFPDKPHREGPLRLGYFGAIDDGAGSYRNPDCLFKIVEQMPETAIRMEFYGAINISSAWQQRLGERLFIGSRLSHREVFKKMAEMDALLLLHTQEDGADEVVTGKVFEYVASRLPIVSIGPAGMAVNKLLSEDLTLFCAEHARPDEIASMLSRLCQLKAAHTLPQRNMARAVSYSRERQFATLFDVINARAQG